MDYYKLGETAGKAWRLGHMGASQGEIYTAAKEAAERLAENEAANFYHDEVGRGFYAGVLAVDKQAQQVKRPTPVSRDELTFEERIEVLEGLVRQYRELPGHPTNDIYKAHIDGAADAYFERLA